MSSYTGLAAKIRGGAKTAEAAEYEGRPPRLTIVHRKVTRTGFRWWSALLLLVAPNDGALRMELDEEVVATLLPGESAEVETTSGEHRLRVFNLTNSSRVRTLSLNNGQSVLFWCQPTLTTIVLERQH
jgi:hypothetical protein